METYVFNVNFLNKKTDQLNLIEKQRIFMHKCNGPVVISSYLSKYNYNDLLQYDKLHIKSLNFGLYIEDQNGKVQCNNHFPKTKAVFIASMWSKDNIYVVAKNGFFVNGKHFNYLIKNEKKENMKNYLLLDDIYLIYLKGDLRNNIFLKDFHIYFDEQFNTSIISYFRLDSSNILNHIKSYTYVYTDSKYDVELLNMANESIAIGDDINIAKLNNNVDHVNSYYFVNKYIETLQKTNFERNYG